MTATAFVNLPRVSARFAHGAAATTTALASKELDFSRALLVGSPAAESRHADIWSHLEEFSVARFFGAESHCPIEVVDACRACYREHSCDSVIAIGGGSTLGLGKILSAEEGARFVALPTTYSGSEMTSIFGRKADGRKKTAVDPACRPDLVIYDAELSMELPQRVSIASAMNSIAHAAESLYPQIPNPLAATMAKECLEAHRQGLLRLVDGADEYSARMDLLYGAFLGGLVVGMCGIALHHQLCHIVGGLYDIPHADSNSVILPQALDYNRDFVTAANETIVGVFGGESAASGVFDFAERIGAPVSLRSIGIPEEGLEQIVQTALAHRAYNPRPLDEESLCKTLQNAFEGSRPG